MHSFFKRKFLKIFIKLTDKFEKLEKKIIFKALVVKISSFSIKMRIVEVYDR